MFNPIVVTIIKKDRSNIRRATNKPPLNVLLSPLIGMNYSKMQYVLIYNNNYLPIPNFQSVHIVTLTTYIVPNQHNKDWLHYRCLLRYTGTDCLVGQMK